MEQVRMNEPTNAQGLTMDQLVAASEAGVPIEHLTETGYWAAVRTPLFLWGVEKYRIRQNTPKEIKACAEAIVDGAVVEFWDHDDHEWVRTCNTSGFWNPTPFFHRIKKQVTEPAVPVVSTKERFIVMWQTDTGPTLIDRDNEAEARAEAERISKMTFMGSKTITLLKVVATLEPKSRHEWRNAE
jgi:hypothetical protein